MYKIIADSAADMDERLLERYPVRLIPFKLYVDGREYLDDAALDVDAFVQAFTDSPKAPKSACPSPDDFLTELEGAEEYYIVTITSKLSGTYNSAALAEKMFREEGRAGRVHVFDSKGAGSAETLIIKKIHDLKRAGKSYDEVVREVEAYIDGMRLYFISESLDNLVKNGRISRWKGLLASTLHILPIMGAEDGDIKLIEKVRNLNKAYQRLIDIVAREIEAGSKRIVAITHVGNLERASEMINQLIERTGLKIENFLTVKAAGLTSMYADRRGIIVSL